MFSALRTRIRDAWAHRYVSRDDHLLDHVQATFEAVLERYEDRRDDPELGPLIARLGERLARSKSWENIYQTALLGIPLLSDVELDDAIAKRLIEIRPLVPQPIQDHYRQVSERDRERPAREMLLASLIEELHRYRTLERNRSFYATVTRIRTGSVFVVAFFAFFLPGLVPDTLAGLIHGFIPGAPTRPGNVLTVISSGFLGAAFSMLVNLDARLHGMSLDDLRMMSRFSSIAVRVIIGMGASVILYYFLQAGILTGPLLPEFDFANDGVVQGKKNLALLIIASFLAGFSERLVPSILLRTERQIGSHPTGQVGD